MLFSREEQAEAALAAEKELDKRDERGSQKSRGRLLAEGDVDISQRFLGLVMEEDRLAFGYTVLHDEHRKQQSENREFAHSLLSGRPWKATSPTEHHGRLGMIEQSAVFVVHGGNAYSR